jgi:acyl-CoA dehydrogenase
MLRPLVLPLGQRHRGPSDRLGHEVASLLIAPTESRRRLTAGLFYERKTSDPVGLMELALEKVIAAEPIEAKLSRALSQTVTPENVETLIARGLRDGVIAAPEAEVLQDSFRLMREAIAVDDFPARARKAGQQAA